MRGSFAIGSALLLLIGCGPQAREPADAPAPPPDADENVVDAMSCEPCDVTGSGTFCGVGVTINPFATGGPFGGFQSQTGTGASMKITITLAVAINWVSVKVIDPDFAGNYVRAYDINNQLVSEYTVSGDGTAHVLTEESGGTGGVGIVRVELVPAPADYVAYDELQVVPAGCAPIL